MSKEQDLTPIFALTPIFRTGQISEVTSLNARMKIVRKAREAAEWAKIGYDLMKKLFDATLGCAIGTCGYEGFGKTALDQLFGIVGIPTTYSGLASEAIEFGLNKIFGGDVGTDNLY